jgi:DNA-binding response OmpR family regulator
MMNAPNGPGRRRRLFAVDDNRLILRVIQDYFAPKGWDVTIAESVAAARVALAASDPDVIVSDILMPEVDGWTFFEDVRKRKETAAVPFVFLTVERELPQRLRGLHLGADDYMTKPFAVEELYARIERLLERIAALMSARSATDDSLLAGSVEHLAISDLLQILSLNGKDGSVRLKRREDEGRIEFAGGRIVDAQAGSAVGTKALFRMLGWADATFRVLPSEGDVTRPTIAAATATVLMDGLVSLDEWARWGELLPGPDTRIELSDDARGRLFGHSLTPAEFDVLARSKSGVTVARAIDDSPHPDAKVAEAICTLLARGVVRAAAKGSQAGTFASR